MPRFNAINLAELPPPDVVEELEFEVILDERKATMAEGLAEVRPDWDPTLESDTTVIHLEEGSYREVNVRQRVNDGARAVLLPTATGADLDNIAARYHVARQVIDPGDETAIPPIDPVYETDDRLRARAVLAYEALSTAGPRGAYISAAVNADVRIPVNDNRYGVTVSSPAPCEVLVTIMSSEGDGVAPADLINAVQTALSDEDTRPLTDHVTVQAGEKIDYQVTAQLVIYDGPDAEVVRAVAEASVSTFVAGQRLLGEPVTIDGLHKALRVVGVKKVILLAPTAHIEPTDVQFAHCTAVNVTVAS